MAGRRYLSRAEKHAALAVAAMQGFMEEQADTWEKIGRSGKLLQYARSARTYAKKTLEELLGSLDPGEEDKLRKEIPKMELMTLYTDQARREAEKLTKLDSIVPVEREDFLDLCEAAVIACVGCKKTGQAAEGCRLKGLLIQYDIEPFNLEAEEGTCPYQQ